MSKNIGENSENSPSYVDKLWNTKWALKRITMVMLTGFGVGFIYYGIQLNVENLYFNLYFTVAINAMMEIPAVFIGSILLSFTNRHILFSSSSFLAGICSILCILFSSSTKRGRGVWFYGGLNVVKRVVYIYCVELFRTNVRNFAVSMLRMALTLGDSISPILVVYGRLIASLSYFVFGILSVFSGLVSLWLHGTRSCPLYMKLWSNKRRKKDWVM